MSADRPYDDDLRAEAARIAALHAYEKAFKAEAAGVGSAEATATAREAALAAGADNNAISCAAGGFIPEKVRTPEYPHPVGTVMRGSFGSTSTVVERNGYAFLACCTAHEAEGKASGYFVQASHGRILDRSEPAGINNYDCPHVPGQMLA